MNLVKNLVLIVLFFLLSPNILFRLPGNKYVSALLHGALLSIIWYFSNPVLEGIVTKPIMCKNIKKKLENPKLTVDQRKHVQKQMADFKC